MHRLITVTALAATLASGALAQEVTEEETARIMELLAVMNCEMDAGDIEKEDDGYDLDDVFCADGQQDIKLNAAFELTGIKKE